MKNWKKWADRLLTLAFGLCVLVVVWVLLQVTCFTSFRVPSPSMYPALIPGDYILVNKWLMGARIFDIWEAVEGKDVKIHRLPGLRKVKRNDVLVFHYPYPHRNDSISMDMMLYYVKRCIALPGDTVEIRKGCYWINGTRKDRRWARMETEPSQEDSLQWNVALGWTVQQLGPLPVPARGQEVAMDTLTGKMYGRLIAWEQKKPLTLRGDSVFLGDSLIGNYRFQENYYFMAGDNLDNSKDSRYWGLVPEPYIVGVATRVWKSVSPQGGEVRWNRTMKKIE
jgi:signal peptidase I